MKAIKKIPKPLPQRIIANIYTNICMHTFNLASVLPWLADPEHCFNLQFSGAAFPHFQAAWWGWQGQDK